MHIFKEERKMQYYDSFRGAAMEAARYADTWVLMDGHNLYKRETLLGTVTEAMEREHHLEEGEYFVTTREGAIGIMHKWEFNISWMLFPEAPFEEYVQEVAQNLTEFMEEEEAAARAEMPGQGAGSLSAIPQTVSAAPVQQTVSAAPIQQTVSAAPVQQAVAAAAPAAEAPQRQFCRKCGEKLSPGVRFCKKCGTQV